MVSKLNDLVDTVHQTKEGTPERLQALRRLESAARHEVMGIIRKEEPRVPDVTPIHAKKPMDEAFDGAYTFQHTDFGAQVQYGPAILFTQPAVGPRNLTARRIAKMVFEANMAADLIKRVEGLLEQLANAREAAQLYDIDERPEFADLGTHLFGESSMGEVEAAMRTIERSRDPARWEALLSKFED